MRSLVVAACMLAVVSGFALILSGGSTTHAQIQLKITVEKVSGKESTYRATDNLIPLSGSQTWHFVVIVPQGVCDADAFSGVNAISYVEGNDQTVAVSVGTATICFRSSTPVLVGDPTVLYGGISTGDNVGPRVNRLSLTLMTPKSLIPTISATR